MRVYITYRLIMNCAKTPNVGKYAFVEVRIPRIEGIYYTRNLTRKKPSLSKDLAISPTLFRPTAAVILQVKGVGVFMRDNPVDLRSACLSTKKFI